MVEAYFEYKKYNNVDKILYRYSNELQNISFLSENHTLMNGPYIVKVDENFRDRHSYIDSFKTDKNVWWSFITSVNTVTNAHSIALLRRIIHNNKTLAVMILEINMEKLNNILRQESFDTIIINNEGIVVASNIPQIVGMSKAQLGLVMNKNNGYMADAIFFGNNSKVIMSNISIARAEGSFEILSIFPVDTILSYSKTVSAKGYTIIAFAFVVSLLLIISLSGILLKRINILNDEINVVASGQFGMQSIISGNDEIGQLARNFSMMSEKLQQLIKEVYEADLQKKQLIIEQKEIKLQILANQVNPHFLFNALESIRMKAICNQQREIADVVRMLGELLRRTLSVGNSRIALSLEIELIENYLKIQKFRFENKLSYLISCSVDAANIFILPLLLQPVVENAVIHGIENKEDAGKVEINICLQDNLMIIDILDDGTGIPQDKLNEILLSLDESTSFHGSIGLKNVHQRIKMYYGEKYGLIISSSVNIGTKVQIKLPVDLCRKDDKSV